MKTSFEITDKKKMTFEELMDFYIEHEDVIEKFWESRGGKRYGELMKEYEEMDEKCRCSLLSGRLTILAEIVANDIIQRLKTEQ